VDKKLVIGYYRNEYWRIVGLDSGYGSYSLEVNGHSDNLPSVIRVVTNDC